MAVPEPVRRGAGVVNCKSKPFDHICKGWSHLLPSNEWKNLLLYCVHDTTFTHTSQCYSHQLKKKTQNKWMRDMRRGYEWIKVHLVRWHFPNNSATLKPAVKNGGKFKCLGIMISVVYTNKKKINMFISLDNTIFIYAQWFKSWTVDSVLACENAN